MKASHQNPGGMRPEGKQTKTLCSVCGNLGRDNCPPVSAQERVGLEPKAPLEQVFLGPPEVRQRLPFPPQTNQRQESVGQG